MDDSKTSEQIKLEIAGVDKMIHGIFHYLVETDHMEDGEIGKYFDDDTLDSNEYRKQIGPEETLKRLVELLQNIKNAALTVGIPEADITNEKLIGYYSMDRIELDQRRKERHKLMREGKSLEEAVAETHKPKLH